MTIVTVAFLLLGTWLVYLQTSKAQMALAKQFATFSDERFAYEVYKLRYGYSDYGITRFISEEDAQQQALIGLISEASMLDYAQKNNLKLSDEARKMYGAITLTEKEDAIFATNEENDFTHYQEFNPKATREQYRSLILVPNHQWSEANMALQESEQFNEFTQQQIYADFIVNYADELAQFMASKGITNKAISVQAFNAMQQQEMPEEKTLYQTLQDEDGKVVFRYPNSVANRLQYDMQFYYNIAENAEPLPELTAKTLHLYEDFVKVYQDKNTDVAKAGEQLQIVKNTYAQDYDWQQLRETYQPSIQNKVEDAYITAIDEQGRLLIVPMENAGEATWYKYYPNGQTYKIGQRVQVYTTGIVSLSYPGQGSASQIRILAPKYKNTVLSEQEAVALVLQQNSEGIIQIKDVKYDKDVWQITLLSQAENAVEQTITIADKKM